MTRITTKTVRLLVLAELAQAGLLAGKTYRELGALLGCDPATAYRAVRDLATAQAQAPEIVAEARRRLEMGKE